MSKTALNIGLFGGSFDPPHLGHDAVVKDLLHQNIFDELWLLPVFEHAFGKNLTPFADRLAMIQSWLQTIPEPQLKTCLIERDLGKHPSYSIDTVTALKEKYPDKKFTLIVGSDVKADLPKWHRSEELQKLVDFYFLPRAGLEDSPYPNVSSTLIRNKIRNQESLANLVPDAVAKVILARKLYVS